VLGSIPRACAFTGLAASTAAVAHGGPVALGDAGWMAAAAGGAAVAALMLWQGWRLVAACGRVSPVASLAGLIPAMLVAQAAAHEALLWAGAPAHSGAQGSLALHMALAVVAAMLVRRIELQTAAGGARAGPADAEPPAGPEHASAHPPRARAAADRLTRFNAGRRRSHRCVLARCWSHWLRCSSCRRVRRPMFS
jgi:hypothetical protein